jgi:Polyketide cyclase / dehydrase and lipid transport
MRSTTAGRVRADVNRVRHDVDATPDAVWNVLADGWLYPLWVVGATRMREVEDEWPEVGSKLHHSVGVWPLVLDDDTEVVECTPGRMLRLRARGWPGGEADVTLRLEERGAGTEVSIEEDIVDGPARYVPQPLRGLILRARNRETLQRLAWLAERRE